MTIIEQLIFLASVYTQYAKEFTNNRHFATNKDNNIIIVKYEDTCKTTSVDTDYDYDQSYRHYSVYSNYDYIGAILIYDGYQVAFKPSSY